MTAGHDDKDPKARWEFIRDQYSKYGRVPYCEFVRPMVDLAAWAAVQPWAAPLYPVTSHWTLCVSLKPGYHPDSPFFSCEPRRDGDFECTLWTKVGRAVERRRFPMTEARSAFWEFARRLQTFE